MKQARFGRVQDLFDAFPTARHDVGETESHTPSMDFLRALVERRNWEPAISFCAYLLPRREAVAWGCRSLHQMSSRFDEDEQRAIAYAEEWTEEPVEWRRNRALALGNRNDRRSAATWLALAAGWSGGSVMPPEFDHREPPPHQTARAVRVALFIGLSRLARGTRDRIMMPCMRDGLQAARGERARREVV